MHKTYDRAERRLTHSLTRGVSVRLRALSSRKQLPRSDEDPLVEFVKCVGSHQDPGGSDLRAPAPAPRSSREGAASRHAGRPSTLATLWELRVVWIQADSWLETNLLGGSWEERLPSPGWLFLWHSAHGLSPCWTHPESNYQGGL